ncbi:MAG: hypothetical protein H0U92_04985, partial [Actinobacteria bacterium]|nr:hypothetical protein [Actinomycetota bacterium]
MTITFNRLVATKRSRRVTAAASAIFISGVVVASPWILSANAAGTNAGAATVVTPAGSGGGQPLTAGTKDTDFSLKLPSGAACTGDSANDGYRVQSYHVPASVDPSTLTFDASGPIPNGVGANFRQPLYQTNSSPYVDAQTAPASPAPGPGPIVNIPAFDFSQYDATTLPAGTYNIGIACTKGSASPTQQDKFWNVQLNFAADNSWTVVSTTPSTTTTSSTSTSTTSSTSTSTTSSTSTSTTSSTST